MPGEWNSLPQQKLAKILEFDADPRLGNARPECGQENACRFESRWEIASDPKADGAYRINAGKRYSRSSPDFLLVRFDCEASHEGFGNPELLRIESCDLLLKLGRCGQGTHLHCRDDVDRREHNAQSPPGTVHRAIPLVPWRFRREFQWEEF